MLITLLAIIGLGFTSGNQAIAEGSVEGAVINQDAEPVPGAHVMIVSAVRERGERPFHERTEAADNGGFVFNDVPAGDYIIVAGMWEEGHDREEIEVLDDEVTMVELQLNVRGENEEEEIETGSISGTVVDDEDNPVEGAMVSVMLRIRRMGAWRGGFDFRNLRATTDENGEFEMAEVPVGNHILFAMAFMQGFARGEAEVRADENTEVELIIEGWGGGDRGGGGGCGGGDGGGGGIWNGDEANRFQNVR